MSSWMNEGAVQNHGFSHLDPSTTGGAILDPTFLNNATSFDPSQFQNQQLQNRMPNGGVINRNGTASPAAFTNPPYQTNSVIPSKRPRPREDSLGTSPRQNPGMLPNSRSHTPQQNAFPVFQPNATSQAQGNQQTPYSHLQNGSANASPSPIMANQMRSGGVPQRVATASPHPFSPAAQQFPQASPSQSEHGGRVETPQSSTLYAQSPGFNQNFNPNFPSPAGRSSAPPQNPMSAPHMQQQNPMTQQQMFAQQAQHGQPQQRPAANLEQQKLLYQMRLQQQLQQQNLMNAQRGNMPSNANPMARGPIPGANGQMPGMRPQQNAQPRSGLTPEAFMKNLASFMQSKNLPLDMNPMVGDRPLALATLYMTVVKFGGYKKVTAQNGWASVAQTMQFNPMQNPNIPQQIKVHYERNLLMFEEAWQISQQRHRAAMMQQQNPNMGATGPAMSPTKQMSPQASVQQPQNFMQQPQQTAPPQPQATPVKQMMPMQQPVINGFSTPQPAQTHALGPQNQGRNNSSHSVNATPPQHGPGFTVPSPVSATKANSLSLASPHADAVLGTTAPPPQEFNLPTELDPKVRVLDTFGGVEIVSLAELGTKLMLAKPDVPSVGELGVIDIHALTMSLQCGIHSEVRLALDILVLLSVDSRLQLDLRSCEDLVETLVDCAEVQVDVLAENASEVSDVMLINSYEDVIRACRCEQELLQDIPEFGSPEYELDRAVDRLICVTTILRNLSFYADNHPLLADDLVIKFLCIVIRYLGTRNMLLRTNKNTLDFMKDVIIFLSNLSQTIEIPGREQAVCLLHFLLAFAPCPLPNAASDRITFSTYDPAVHRYLPSAVDSLAKLLARDEPNRTHYKTIFSSDVASTIPYDLLTRTFALAISGVPNDKQEIKRGNLVPVIEARKPFLMQGLLAAEMLANLAPGYASGVARSWLTSDDGFSQNLIRLIFSLCLEASPQMPQQRTSALPRGAEDNDSLNLTISGIGVLRRLADKSRDPDDPKSMIPLSGLLSVESLLGVLKTVHPRLKDVLRDLCAYAGLST